MPQGLRVRVPLCAINLKTGRKSGFFNLYAESTGKLPLRGRQKRRDEKAGALYEFEAESRKASRTGGATSAEGQRGDLWPRPYNYTKTQT